MAKANQSDFSLEKVQDELNHQETPENIGELLDNFEKMEQSKLQTITGNYQEFDENETYNFIFNGMTTFKGKNGDVPAVELVDRNGKKTISGLTVLVNNLKKVTQIPCFVRIATKRFVKTENGKYLDMDILTLPQSVEK